jgi:hypothetical protein
LDGRRDDERTGLRLASFNLIDGGSFGRSLRSSAISILRKPTLSWMHGRAVCSLVASTQRRFVICKRRERVHILHCIADRSEQREKKQ